MQNEKCYFSILYTLYKCTSYIFASQPASFNQGSSNLGSACNNAGQSNYNGRIWQPTKHLVTHQPRTHTASTLETNTHTVHAHTRARSHTHSHTHTLVGTQERTCIVTLAHPHACTSVHFITQSNRTFKNSLSWLYAVGELGFNSRS